MVGFHWRLNRDRKTPHVIRLDADKQSVARIRAEKGKFRALGAAAARADLGMSQRNRKEPFSLGPNRRMLVSETSYEIAPGKSACCGFAQDANWRRGI